MAGPVVRILGIDPGSRITGYGLIDTDGRQSVHVASGCIRTTDGPFPARLAEIFVALGGIIDEHAPAECAVEKVFVNRNVESAMKLGHARGAAIVAAATREVEVFEFSPNEIKQAIVGRGHADKQQVQHMVGVLLGLREALQADTADALAAALCHGHTRFSLQRVGTASRARGGRYR